MLVLVSDLHLGDGSATADNVPPDAFAIWLEDVLALARHNGAREIELVYLGDIFDLIRTEYWFYPDRGGALPATPQPESFPLADRPWGSRDVNVAGGKPSAACLERARAILGRIRERCNDQLAFMSGDLARLGDDFLADPERKELVERLGTQLAALSVTRLYVPGNHDRLFLHDPALAQGMLEALGARPVPAEKGGPHAYRDGRHGVIARHGHEWDVWNFEGYREGQVVDALKPADYALAPVGDAIATELMARLPYATYLELCRTGAAPDLAGSVYEHLRQIEDVRPLHAAIKWVLVRAQDLSARWPGAAQRQILGALETAVRDTVARFESLPFVERWVEQHDHWNLGFDEADKLQDVCRLLRHASLGSVEKVLAAVDKLQSWGLLESDHTDAGAARERFETAGSDDVRYCVYGHTHVFRHDPLSCDASGGGRVYFNSGTWRPRVAETRDGRGFVPFKEMTWLVFYRDDEDPAIGPGGRRVPKGTSYETWNGTMLKRPRE